MLNWYKRLAKYFEYSSEEEEEIQKRGILILLIGLTCAAGFVYSLIYGFLGVEGATIPIIIYIGMCVLNLIIFKFSSNYKFFRVFQLLAILIFPFLTHVWNGGMEQTSAVVLASMMSPLGALIFFESSKSRAFFILFLIVIASAISIDYFTEPQELNIPKGVKLLFYFFNITIITAICFFLLLSFVNQNQEYKSTLKKRNYDLAKEKKRSDDLLLSILPAEVAEELKEYGESKAKKFEHVSVMFTDFKEFTQISAQLSPEQLVKELNFCFKKFDMITVKHGIEKIKTIGDAYMAAGGLSPSSKQSALKTVRAALAMQEVIKKRKKEQLSKGLPFFEMRVGVHTGTVVAGIVGVKKFQYDIWGDVVNTASRLENSCEIGEVNISGTTQQEIKAESSFDFDYRGEIDVKGKGLIEMYYVRRSDLNA